MGTFVVFMLVLSVLVLVHEFGHFAAARWFGIKVEEFAFGLPLTKPILKFKRGETQYSIYPLLFGGFVKLYGEEKEAEDKKRTFWDRGRKQRMAVIAAGVIMNVVLALAAFGFLYSSVGVPVRKVDKVTVVKVEPGSPADKAGIKVNDRIVSVEGKTVDVPTFTAVVKSWAGVEVNLGIQRGSGLYLFEGISEGPLTKLEVSLTPRVNPPENQGPTGIIVASYPYVEVERITDVSLGRFVLMTLKASANSTGVWVGRIIDGLRGIGKSLVAGQVPQGVGGPVQIYELTGVVAQGGFWPVVELVAILSVNLAVFNVLPIPALDGGRMFFIVLEWVRRKRMTAELEEKINSWGMAFLIALIILITLQDVIKTGVLARFGLK